MKIRTGRGPQAELRGQACQASDLAGIEACAHHLEGVSPGGHEGGQQLPQAAAAQCIAGRMRQHGTAAGGMEPPDHFADGRPFNADIGSAAAFQKQLERLRPGARMTGIREPLRKVSAPDHRMPFEKPLGTAHTKCRQPFGDGPAAIRPDAMQRAEPAFQNGVIQTYIEPDDVDRMPFPHGRDLDTRNDRHVVPARCRARRLDTDDGIVVGDGQHAHTRRRGGGNQCLGRQPAIRADCVSVQIVVHLPLPFLWTKGPMTPIPPLPEVPVQMTRIRRSLLAVAPPAGTLRPDDDLEALLGVTQEFIDMLIRLDKEQGATTALADEATRLGNTGLGIFTELASRSGRLGLTGIKSEIERVTVAVADWVMRHHGRISALDPIVNGLALIANEVQDPAGLAEVADFMNRLADGADDTLRADLDRSNRGRPWRILNLNCAIVATRSHDIARMTRVFDELIQRLPEDAAAFFQEGMRQMEVIDYPPQVRTVMQHYFHAFSQRARH